MLIQGSSKRAIALYLNEHGVPSPSAYKVQKGLPVSTRGYDDPMWGVRMIHSILTNPTYTGDLAQGRSRVKSYKVHQIEAVPREEWVEVAGTHEAIIDYETFDKVQALLQRDMAMPNAKMLLGNHELMMMNALYYPPPEDEEWPDLYYGPKLSLWYRNGGQITHNYLKHIKKTVRQEIFEYLEKLPLNIELTLNNRQFILTHAAPVELYETYGHKYECERDFAVWMRFDSFPVLEDCTVIFGHTPTIRFQYDNPMAIWDAKSWIGIDCGCMLPEKGDPWSGALGRLSCLRLDDMQVFYSEEPQYDNLKESEEQHDG